MVAAHGRGAVASGVRGNELDMTEKRQSQLKWASRGTSVGASFKGDACSMNFVSLYIGGERHEYRRFCVWKGGAPLSGRDRSGGSVDEVVLYDPLFGIPLVDVPVRLVRDTEESAVFL